MRAIFGTVASGADIAVGSVTPAPYLVELGTAIFVPATAHTSVTPTIPASVAAGDLVLVFGASRNSGAITVPAGQGWTAYTALHSSGAPFLHAAVWAKIWGAGDTDDDTPTFTRASTSEQERWVAAIFTDDSGAWANVADAVAGSATDNNIASGTTLAAPSATDNGTHRTVIRYWASSDDNALNNPSAGTLLFGDTTYNVGGNCAMAATVLEDVTVTTNTGTATITESVNGPDTGCAVTLSLKVHT